MQHAEKRHRVWYAKLAVPADVHHIIGKVKFFKSTQTESAAKAAPRVALLVSQWQGEIAKARGTLPNPKDDFWQSLRQDYINAKDEDHELVVQDIARAEAEKAGDAGLYRVAIGVDPEPTPLAPLLVDWMASMANLKAKTRDQRYRDVSKMAAQFVTVEKLQPKAAKVWADKLIEGGATAVTMERTMEGCRSLWRYLRDASVVPVDASDPFAGAGRLAIKAAKRNTVMRLEFTPDELAKVYQRAVENGDRPLASLIALGAYSGARIEELCALTIENCTNGVFVIKDSKTKAGIRQVPIHPALSKLVKAMVKESSAAGATKDGEPASMCYLVPSTAAGKYGARSGPLSKRYGRLKSAMGFSAGHVFHSLRHGVVTQLHQAGAPSPVISDIVGHEKGVFTLDKYGSGSSMVQKAEALANLKYPGALAMP